MPPKDTRALRVGLPLLALCVAGLVGAWWFRNWQASPPRPDLMHVLSALENGDPLPAQSALAFYEGQPESQGHAHLLKGALFLRREQLEQALDEFAQAEPKGELAEPAHLLTGECLYRMGRLVEAEPVLQRVAASNPKLVDAHRWLGAVYYDLGANGAAEIALTRAAQLAPEDYRPHRLMGLMALDFEHPEQAIPHYRKALERSPPDAEREEIQRELARALIMQRKHAAALDVLKECRPDTFSRTLEAECHWSLGQVEQAETRRNEARLLNPDERRLLLLESRMHLARKEAAQAILPLKKVLLKDPHDTECRYQLAMAYRQIGQKEDHQREMVRFEESQALMRKLADLSLQAVREPANVTLRHQLADVCDALGKRSLAAMWRRAAAAYQLPTPETP